MTTPQPGAPAAPARAAPRPPPARQLVRRAAVLGAGTMGAQIAALLASHGVPCDLLDLPAQVSTSDERSPAVPTASPSANRLAEEAKRQLSRISPSPVFTADALSLIRPGNFATDLLRLRDADWVIEAIVEKLDAKRQLWSSVAPHLRPGVIASSNTSGIPIASIAEALPPDLRRRFLGTHFFNPPRYLRLLEVVPTAETDPMALAAIRRFAEEVLGKRVVVARDTPNFIANRFGCYGLIATLKTMEAFSLGPEDVDAITGQPMGRPNSATFRTLDLVGIDVFLDVCDNMRGYAKEPWEQKAFEVPAYFREMVARRWTGEKAGQGFYKRVKQGEQIDTLVLEVRTLEYRARKRGQWPSISAVRNLDDPARRIKALVTAEDAAGRFAWQALSRFLEYAALRVDEVAGDIASIDQAMRWGFGWELGPFETWDGLGVASVVDKMRSEGLHLTPWVLDLASKGRSFYRLEGGQLLQATPSAGLVPVPVTAKEASFTVLRASRPVIAQRPGASLYDLGDGLAFLDFHSPRQAIGPDMVQMLGEACRRATQEFRGLVIGSHVQPNFCVGANLFFILLAAQEGEWEEVNAMVRQFQGALLQLKRLPVPVVVAPYGLTLGGGAELALAASRVVGAMETYIGLVEVGAGLLPAGGGCKEMLLRWLETLPGGAAGFGVSSGGPPGMAPPADPNPAVLRAFEAIGLAKVATSAIEGRSLGFLRASDAIVPNLDHLLYVARGAALALDTQGYAPPAPVRLPVLGDGTRALLEMAAQNMAWSGYASEHDLKIARKLARVLTGGDRPAGTLADEEYFLDLEREAFLSLCGERRTQARMKHLLDTGRPLRN